MLLQEGIESFSNISGIVYESFKGNDIQSTFIRIDEEIYDAIKEFEYEEKDD